MLNYYRTIQLHYLFKDNSIRATGPLSAFTKDNSGARVISSFFVVSPDFQAKPPPYCCTVYSKGWSCHES